MVDVTGTVGEGGVNAKHDVAIIQLMLRVIKNAKGSAYYTANYSGKYDAATKDALIAFQKDQGLLPEAAKAPAIAKPGAPPVAKPPAPAAGAGEKSGLLTPVSKTLAKLNAALPAKYAGMRIVPDTSTVYMPAAEAEANASAAAITAKVDLDVGFKLKVAAVVNTMYQRHKLALAVAGPGWRRDFALQAAQTKTGAGPGESNHNFGRALDLGFQHFTWVKGNGEFAKEGPWLGSADLGGTKSEQMWTARDAIALKEQGLFLTNFGGERVHLQNFSDTTANNRKSLAKLLSTVGAMKWQHTGAQYQADLGLGAGTALAVGSAKQIWSGHAPVTQVNLAAAVKGKTMEHLVKNPLLAKLPAVKKGDQAIKTAKPGAPALAAKAAKLEAKDITVADLKTIQTALKADFEKADTNWNKWVPVL